MLCLSPFIKPVSRCCVTLSQAVHDLNFFLATSQYGSEHRIDPTTPEGLLDVAMLGNVMELFRYLDARFYDKSPQSQQSQGTIPLAELAEQDFIMSQYFTFQKDFSRRYQLIVNGQPVDAIEGVFKPTLLRLATSIVTYRRNMKSFEAGYSASAIQKAIRDHFLTHHDDLLKKYNQDLRLGGEGLEYLQTMDWMGPEFKIELR
jgi:hypothetical protein